MKDKKPYLLKAIYSWIIDNGCTPYVLVDATYEDVHVVEEHVRNGRIVLNIDTEAVDNLCLDDESISFTAYFGSDNQEKQIFVPMAAVLAIFAQETSDGIGFDDEVPIKSFTKKLGDAAKKKILQKVAVRKTNKKQDSESVAVKDSADKNLDKKASKTKSFLKIVK